MLKGEPTMNNKLGKTVTLLLIAGLFAGLSVSQERANSNIETTFVSSDPVPLQSGEDGDLTFKVRNTGNSVAEDVDLSLIDHYPFQVKEDRQKNYSLGSLAPGEEYYVSTEVTVDEEASDGSSDFRVKVDRQDFSLTKDIPVEVQSQDIELNVANLATSPSTLMPDTDDNRLDVDVVNNGEKTAENVVLNLELPDTFERSSSFSSRQALGNIGPGEVKTASFSFDLRENASSGLTEIPSTLTYSADESSEELEESSVFELDIDGRPQFEIEKNGSKLKAGESGEIRLNVRNTGDEESSSTRVRVLDSSDQPFTYDSSSSYVGTLEPGESGEAVFQVDTDSGADARDYLIDFETRGTYGTEVFVEDTTVKTSVENGEETNYTPFIVVALILLGAGLYILKRKRNNRDSEEEDKQE